MKPTLYIMCGLPFSGKSTIARQLAEKLNIAIVEIDEVKNGYGFRDVWEEMTAENWQKIFDDSFKKARTEIAAGQSVIHDSANQTKTSRDSLRDIAKELNCESKVIFINIPIEIVKKRWQANKISHERMDLPEWAFNAALNNYEPPTDERDVVIINEDDQDGVSSELLLQRIQTSQNIR